MVSVRHGYGKRVKNSIVGAIFGMLMVPGSLGLLIWNERDAVRQTGAITEIEKVALADVSAESVDESMDSKLVHMTSTAETQDMLSYDTFGIRENAMRLRWDASIYQWEEDRKKEDDRTVYRYHKKWVNRPVDSSRFHESHGHSNEGSTMHFQDGQAQAENVDFGAFRLSKKLISQINDEDRLSIPESVALDVRPQGVVKNGVFQTGNPSDPQIGDERVEVYMVGPKHDATIMALQTGNTFASYETRVGIDKEILYLGTLTKSEVIGRQRTEAAIRRWIFRAIGFIVMWIGFACILKPLRSIASFIPFASRLLDGAIGMVTFLIALVLSSAVIAVAWFAVRPILSITVTLIAVAGFYLLSRQKSDESMEQPSGGAVPPPLPST